MSDVFISYKRENEAAVDRVVKGLRTVGFSVWWDQDIAPNAPWEATIERELVAARLVIVAWSQAAVASENVKAEARRARNDGKLIQVFVERCEPPLFFGERQGIDLTRWTGALSDGRFQAVIAAARAILEGRAPPAGIGYAAKRRAPWGASVAIAVGVSTALGVIANLAGARDIACGLSVLTNACRHWGLVSVVVDPTALTEQERQRLLRAVEGTWGRQDRDCSERVTYRIARGSDGFDRIIATAPEFESVGQVITAQDGVIMTRDTTPSSSGGREQWELRPDGDRLVIYDKEGVSTNLVRCPR